VCTLECNVALHVDTTTSADDTYKISQESAEDVSKDQVNITKELTEAPNQSSEDIDISDSVPPVKASPGHNLLFLLHCNLYLFTYSMH
jgi:hypothetical protein